ncbi:CAMK family protein kinase [Trichomonas vaginalis G3]|uniref:CAMK family protein kinase n=1 Tax=Trichomonas vaginalis (strain ATCC PRA-98 / G3) TaxID=412133 RepID=A2FZC2_TRIV3|nr:protein serine/threonine kinase protein [Trichomonas vaginalis G3]EAX89748.1 CAMK family protein kinase [Trichomonas vaginalis G3]KAI5551034.1 protein serine/threonine kinase protein [Trichomonas vaginalis G3]|eukprot:XP_001302678.1 CAMK family protein kinase [Trichomonas vaginalis G3]
MITSFPQTIHSYIFKKAIGKGGFSTVYLVESEVYHQNYVAKVTPIDLEKPHTGDVDPLDAEIKALMNLSHQNIIRLYDHFTEGNNFFVILEYCQLGSLQDSVGEDGLTLQQFICYGRQILSALAFVHSKNIAHRDIKPGNILVDSMGRIKLSDFGISILGANNVVSTFSGSFLYEAPEVILKKPHNPIQADIWSLGVLFAYLINGTTPWRSDNINVLKNRICTATFKLRSNTPPEVAELITSMLNIEPNERPTAQEILEMRLFEKESIEQTISESNSIQDVLSPKGRANRRTLPRNRSSFEPQSKAINIFKMNLMVGSNNMPMIRNRFHSGQMSTFVLDE